MENKQNLQSGSIIEVFREGSNIWNRHISPKKYRALFDKLDQFAWLAYAGLSTPSVAVNPLYTLFDSRQLSLVTVVPKWEHRGRYQDSREPELLSEIKS